MKKLLLFLIFTFSLTISNVFGFDLSEFSYSGYEETFSFYSEFGNFNGDGTELILSDSINDKFVKYDLTTPYELNTATNRVDIDYSSFSGRFRAFAFNDDGTKLFIQNQDIGEIEEYNLSVAYDLTTLSNTNNTLDTNEFLYSIFFNNDGSKLYVVAPFDKVIEYTLTTPYSLASHNLTYTFTTSISNPFFSGGFFNTDGSKLFIANTNDNKIYQFSLSTNFDLSTISNDNETFFYGNQFSNTVSILFKSPDGSRIFLGGGDFDGQQTEINQFNNNVEPPTYDVDLATNYAPYTNFIYFDNEETTFTNTINTTILNNETWGITSNAVNTTPFSFNNWFDVDNTSAFTNDRTFTINDPARNYNLIADFTLNNSVNLSFNSNLPSQPAFEFKTETIETTTLAGIINKVTFDEHEHPYDYDFEITAPTTNIGFYEFDYWYNNSENEIFTFNSVITNSGIENLDLTATYSLPEEYQIDLNIESQIGVITFQLGNQDPITGSVINAIISAGDNWSASVPSQTPDFIFNRWINNQTFNTFSNDNELNVSNTNNDYYLTALYTNLYNVNWNTDGGTLIPSQKIENGEFVNAPSIPFKPNFVFGGWYEEGDINQTEVNFPYQIIEDITFVAIWLDTYTLTFDTNGGSSIDSEIYVAGETPEAVTPSRFGYEFQGWFTDDGTFQNEFNFNNPINQDTTIHAKWAFGSDRDAQLSLTTFLDDNDLGDGFSQIVIMITIYIFVNIVILIYQAPLIVTLILNFIVTSLFMILGWIAIWIVVVIFMSLFGLLYFFSSGRGITE